MSELKLISHLLCPYVQRAAISLAEKEVPFERVDIDLAHKPDWFLKLSPFGKTPILMVDERPIFESAAILEYLEETQPHPLHPSDALTRAEHRGWIEYGSNILSDIAGFYFANDESTFEAKRQQLVARFGRLEERVKATPYFDGEAFSLVDAVFGPVFRYLDAFDRIANFGFLARRPVLARWRTALAARPSISGAVRANYPELLHVFIAQRHAWLSRLQEQAKRD